MSAAPEQNPAAVRVLRIAIWLAFVAAFAVLYYRYSSGTDFTKLAATSAWAAYALYVAICSVRGLALIPATSVVVLAIPLFPPMPLFLLTLVGIVISSATIYAFAGSLRLAEYFERKHAKHVQRLRAALQKHPTTIVAACSFLLVVPTDLVCYVCGALRISFPRFMTGVLIGEGAICAVYIFAGSTLLDLGKRAFGPDVAAAHSAVQASLVLETENGWLAGRGSLPEHGRLAGRGSLPEHGRLADPGRLAERTPRLEGVRLRTG